MATWDNALFLTVLGAPAMAWAAWTTLWVATVAQASGTLIGLAVAPMMLARARVLRLVALAYLWLFRGTPLLAQILFFYSVLPQMGLRLSVVATGLLALGINEGARMAEVVRGGFLAVPHEQREAATALGLHRGQIFFLVTLPQAMRAILPPLGNNYTYMIKATSMLSVISFAELLRTSQQLAQSTARPLEVYAAAAVFYITIVTLATLGQRALERRFARADAPPRRPAGSVAAGAVAPALPAAPKARDDRPVVVEARGLVKRLGHTLALDRVDLVVRRGEVVVLVGPSGSGKSTLLRCLNHLTAPDAGVVLIDGEPIGVELGDAGPLPIDERAVARQRRRIGMVFQRFHLFRHLSARDNVALGLVRLGGVARPEARRRAVALLERLSLGDKALAYPAELSGGQQQRVAIARALAMEPALLLFDEPTSALDPESVNEVLDAIRDLARAGRTMVIVTHEIGFARVVADRIVLMRDGAIVAEGPPDAILGAAPIPAAAAM